MSFNNIKNYENKTLTESIADNISKMIVDKDLKSNDKLPNEFELAEMLNVGRGTIREAIKLLVSRNIVEIRRGKGTFVVSKPGYISDPWGFKFVEDKFKLGMDLLETRLILEPNIAELAALRATNDLKEKLILLTDEVEELINSRKPHTEKDVEYHKCIAECTFNSIFLNIIPLITHSIDIFIDLTKNSLINETIITHRKITNAIVSGSPIEAREAMHEHLMYNKNRIIEYSNQEDLDRYLNFQKEKDK